MIAFCDNAVLLYSVTLYLYRSYGFPTICDYIYIVGREMFLEILDIVIFINLFTKSEKNPTFCLNWFLSLMVFFTVCLSLAICQSSTGKLKQLSAIHCS